MSPLIQTLFILTLFFLFIISLNSPSSESTHFPSNHAFGCVNRIATCVIILLTLLNIVVFKLREFHEADLREKYKPSDQCRRFLLADILSATKNFDDSFVVGQGGFGKVYRGEIDDGKIIVAIKRLNVMSKQGASEFRAEIEILSRIRHSNIDEMILIYEYMVRGTLAEHMHRNSGLCWDERVKICIGAAHGLDYLHTGTGDKSRIIHHDIKSSNVLLGENWTAKISDFGLSKIGPKNEENSHVSTNVKGTCGYVDPEYFLTRQLTRKSDVYAFGVVLFEVLCGRRAVDLSLDMEQRGLVGWAKDCVKDGNLDDIIDPNLRGRILQDSLSVFAQIADQCLHKFPAERPTMAEIVVALELALIKQQRTDFSFFRDEFFNTSGDCDDQENGQSSVKEQVLINSNDKESRAKAPRGMTFTKLVRKFIFGTSAVVSAHSEEKNSKSDDTSSESVTLSSGDPNLKRFEYGELVVATKNFSIDMVMGEGRFGKVYKGRIPEISSAETGIIVAVKKICMPFLRLENLKLRLEFLAKYGHQNLVKILGYCWKDKNFFIVYECMQEGSLERHLFRNSRKSLLAWVTRLKISTQAARGLAFLHTSEKVIYGEFKTSNVLLDRDFNAKLSEYELAKSGRLKSKRDPYIEPSFFYRYASPECMATGHFSLKGVEDPQSPTLKNNKDNIHLIREVVKSGTISVILLDHVGPVSNLTKGDVYCFGVVLVELLTGGESVITRTGPKALARQHLVDWVRPFLIDRSNIHMVVDPRLKGQYHINDAFEYALLANRCLDLKPKRRPSMEEVLKTLERMTNQHETE